MQTIAHILAVDDVPANLVALEAMLKRDDVVIRKASSGEEALELLLEHEFALALLDVQMPGMNGFELAELMRGTERTRQVPIIFLTAGDADSRRQFRGYEAGAVDFILKPVQPDVLRSKVQVLSISSFNAATLRLSATDWLISPWLWPRPTTPKISSSLFSRMNCAIR